MYSDKTRAMSFTRQCRHISQVRWTTKLSCDVKLSVCQEFWCQKLLKSDNYSLTYSQQYQWVFFSETRCTCTEDYTVSKKNCANFFCQNFVKFPPILIIFGRKIAKRLKLCEVHSFSTSPISCHHTTVLNADVPNCQATQR